MKRDISIPDWFWALLDESRPSLQALALLLEGLPRERLIQFAQLYRAAAEEVCDYSRGPVVDDIQFSEDDTEDLCNWVVGQGQSMWQRALSLGADLEPIVRLYWATEAKHGRSPLAWTLEVDNTAYHGYQAPEYIAHGVFAERFGEDLNEILQGSDGA